MDRRATKNILWKFENLHWKIISLASTFFDDDGLNLLALLEEPSSVTKLLLVVITLDCKISTYIAR